MIDPARIAAAASAIDPVFLNSPQLAFPALSEALGLDLTVKVETLNPIGSFKGRGPGWLVHELDDATPLVTASSFHKFYDACRVLPQGDEEPAPIHAARLLLVEATKTVFGTGLTLLGVSAPERM